MHRKLILHIGFPKTGSSTLQAHLCNQPELKSETSVFKYHVVKEGGIVTGASLKRQAGFRPWKHLSSPATLIEALTVFDAHFDPRDYGTCTPILSQENWGNQIAELGNLPDALLKDVDIEVIVFVRPQVEWLQSAWWQWYAWMKESRTVEHVWTRIKKKQSIDWEFQLSKLESSQKITRIHVCLFDKGHDVVSRVRSCLNVPAAQNAGPVKRRRNESITRLHVYLYRKFPWLRPVHDGRFDTLIHALPIRKQKAPWIISPALAEDIVTTLHDSNIRLTRRLSHDDRQQMLDNPVWWYSSPAKAITVDNKALSQQNVSSQPKMG